MKLHGISGGICVATVIMGCVEPPPPATLMPLDMATLPDDMGAGKDDGEQDASMMPDSNMSVPDMRVLEDDMPGEMFVPELQVARGTSATAGVKVDVESMPSRPLTSLDGSDFYPGDRIAFAIDLGGLLCREMSVSYTDKDALRVIPGYDAALYLATPGTHEVNISCANDARDMTFDVMVQVQSLTSHGDLLAWFLADDINPGRPLFGVDGMPIQSEDQPIAFWNSRILPEDNTEYAFAFDGMTTLDIDRANDLESLQINASSASWGARVNDSSFGLLDFTVETMSARVTTIVMQPDSVQDEHILWVGDGLAVVLDTQGNNNGVKLFSEPEKAASYTSMASLSSDLWVWSMSCQNDALSMWINGEMLTSQDVFDVDCASLDLQTLFGDVPNGFFDNAVGTSPQSFEGKVHEVIVLEFDGVANIPGAVTELYEALSVKYDLVSF